MPVTSSRFLSLLLSLLLLGGCSYFQDKKEEDPTESWTAERLYNEAKSSLDAGYYDEAAKYYEKLQIRYPFGVYAQQSQLDLAYAYYKSGDMAAAVAACNRFIKMHPRHSHVDYAYYLKGLAHFMEGKGLTQKYLPTDVSQRDMGSAYLAFQDFSELTRKFPDSKYVADAQKRMVYLRNLLAEHEVEVGEFYLRRKAYVAALNRGRYVVEKFPRAPATPDALALMAKAYKILGMDDLYADTVRVLRLNYPDNPVLSELESIKVE